MRVCEREREKEREGEAIKKFSFAAGTEKQNAGGSNGRKQLKKKPRQQQKQYLIMSLQKQRPHRDVCSFLILCWVFFCFFLMLFKNDKFCGRIRNPGPGLPQSWVDVIHSSVTTWLFSSHSNSAVMIRIHHGTQAPPTSKEMIHFLARQTKEWKMDNSTSLLKLGFAANLHRLKANRLFLKMS